MRFGICLPNNFGIDDANAVADVAPFAEELGYDSVWTNHHVLNVGYVRDRLEGRPYQDALTMLTWAAARTEQVRLGTSVLVLPYLSPFSLAKALATLDHLSGGRVVCGLGVGSLEPESDALGLDYARRGAWANEAIEVMAQLWYADDPAYDGEFFSFADVKAAPKPVQTPLPLYIGGNRGPALRRVAAYAQGWHPLAPSPAGLAERHQRLAVEVEKVGPRHRRHRRVPPFRRRRARRTRSRPRRQPPRYPRAASRRRGRLP